MARGPQPYVQTIVWKYIDRGFKAAKKKYDSFTESMAEATDATRSMEARAASNATSMKSMGSTAGETADDVDDMAESSARAAGVIDRMKNSSNGAVRALGQMAGKIRAAATSAKLWVAGGIAASIIAFSAAVGTATAKAIGFENALNEARKTADLSEAEFQSLSKQLLEVQAELGTSQQDLAAIAAEAGRLGIEGTDNISEFTRTVALMSEATDVTAQNAAQGLARVTNAFNLPISRAKALGSVLNELSNQTVASTSDLIDALTRVGAAGKQIGLTADEVAGMSATLIDAGISARRAGTGLRTIFTRLLNETDKVAGQMDVTREELLQTFEEDGVRAVEMYLESLREMEKAQRAAAIEDIFGVEQSQKVQALVQNLGNMKQQIADAGEEMKEADSLTAEFAKTTQDVANEWNRLTAKLSAWVTDWGTEFTGYLESALSTLNDMMGGANELARDLTTASERLSGLDSDIELISRFQTLQAQGEDTADVLEEMQARFPDEFFQETADGIEVATGRLKEYVTQQRAMAERSVQARQAQAVRELNTAYQNLQRAQARSQQEGLSTEEWREYRKQIDQARERLEALAPVLVEQFAENGEVARQELQKLANSVDLRSFIGLEDISEDEAIERLIQLWRTYREEKEQAADTPDPGDGGGGGDGGDTGTEEVPQPAGPDFAALAERARKISQNASQFLEDFAPARVEAVTGAFRDELSKLRLELERGAITQEEFQKRAAEMAKRYRGELIRVIQRLEEMGLITPEVAKKAVEGFKSMEDQAEKTEEQANDTEESLQDVGQALQDAARLTRGISELSEALGGIGEEAKNALNGVSSLLDSTGRLMELSSQAGGFGELFGSFGGAVSGTSTIVGAIGGVAQLISSLSSITGGSGMQSQEELRELQVEIQKNREELRRNTNALLESAIVGENLKETTEDALVSTMYDLQSQLDDFSNNDGSVPTEESILDNLRTIESSGVDAVEGVVDLFKQEREAGASVQEALQRVLKGAEGDGLIELGDPEAELSGLEKTITRLSEKFGQFGESLDGIVEQMRFARNELGAGPEGLRDIFLNRIEEAGFEDPLTDYLRGRVESLDIEDEDAVKGFLDELRRRATGQSEFGIPAGEDAAGNPTYTSLLEALGEASPGGFQSLIDAFSSAFLDGGGGADSGPDTRITSQVQRTITETQASQWATYLQEQMHTQRSIESHVAAIRSILAQETGIAPDASTLTQLASSTGESPATGQVEASVYVTAEMSAQEIAEKMEEAFQQFN